MTKERVTSTQTVDMSAVTPDIQYFILEGYPGFASQLSNPKGPFVREYEPGSVSEGVISRELLPIQIQFRTGKQVIIDSDATGRSLVLKFAPAAAKTRDIPVKSLEPMVAAPMILPPVVERHPELVPTA